ncbi:hypothetical protein GCM10027053_01120 [Intrasporangium mesophilum]
MRRRARPDQLACQRAGFGLFFHLGINTFNGVEWSDGTLHPDTSLPSERRTPVGRDRGPGGARDAVLTAKHHDGF